jgi:hypothetical protein
MLQFNNALYNAQEHHSSRGSGYNLFSRNCWHFVSDLQNAARQPSQQAPAPHNTAFQIPQHPLNCWPEFNNANVQSVQRRWQGVPHQVADVRGTTPLGTQVHMTVDYGSKGQNAFRTFW